MPSLSMLLCLYLYPRDAWKPSGVNRGTRTSSQPRLPDAFHIRRKSHRLSIPRVRRGIFQTMCVWNDHADAGLRRESSNLARTAPGRPRSTLPPPSCCSGTSKVCAWRSFPQARLLTPPLAGNAILAGRQALFANLWFLGSLASQLSAPCSSRAPHLALLPLWLRALFMLM